MSMASARGWGAASQGIGNLGEALLRELARQKEQELAGRQVSLQEELGRGQLALGRDELGERGRQFDAGIERDYTMGGFERTGGAAPAPGGQSAPGNIFAGQGIGMAAEAQNPGGALLRMISGQQPPAPEAPSPAAPEWRYNPERDPAALRQGREFAFLGGQNEAERSLRASEGAAERQNRVSVANIGESGATARNDARIQADRDIAMGQFGQESATAQARAVAAAKLEEHGGVRAAMESMADDPETPAKAAIMRELQALQYEQGRRNLLGIGRGGDDISEFLSTLGIQ